MPTIERLIRNGEKTVPVTPAVLSDLIALALRAFGEGMSEIEVADHVLPVDILYVARNNNEVAGFASIRFFETRSYLAGSVVDPTHQGSHIYSLLAIERLSDALTHSNELFTRTQNPVVEYTLHHALNLFKEAGKISGYSLIREHVKGLYGRMLTPNRPFSKDKAINEHYTLLDYPAGDAFKLNFVVSK